ncbi:MAG: ABC transporter permease [Desulfomonilaceae bacterium]
MLKLIFRNVFRHRLRSVLTLSGLAIAMLAFGILRTLIGAWYCGVEASSTNRLITRNKISLVYLLSLAYKNKIVQVSGINGLGFGIWYGGIYKDKKNFFPQLAISGLDYLNLYPEFLLPDIQKRAFENDRRAAIAGISTAERFGWKIGDVIPLQGTIYPGTIELTLKGIYRRAQKSINETTLFFHYDYLNEKLKKNSPAYADKVGWFLVRIKDSGEAPRIAQEIDSIFVNSPAETLTETEKAFQMGFVVMTESILTVVRVIAFVVIGIILIVLVNTMIMTARERTLEYAVLKTMGFGPFFIFFLIAGESLTLALIGGTLGAVLCFPAGMLCQTELNSFLPVVDITWETILLIILVSFAVGVVAAIPPAIKACRTTISRGMRHVG